MKLIGAGFGRTGTESLRIALQRLLGGPCYHMKELVHRPDHFERWRAFVEAGGQGMDWADLFADYEATVDWPGAHYYAELMEVFPDAKVLLSVRDPNAWFDSFQMLVHIHRAASALSFVPRLGAFARMHDELLWNEFPNLRDRQSTIAVFERHIERVKAHVPPDRLLVYRVQEGWEPLCEFLGVPVPAEPFPHANTRNQVKRFAAKRIAREVFTAPVRAVAERLGLGRA